MNKPKEVTLFFRTALDAEEFAVEASLHLIRPTLASEKLLTAVAQAKAIRLGLGKKKK